MVHVLHTQVDATGTAGLREAVVGVVLLVGEDLEPAVHQALGHRLGANVHEAPLVEVVVGQRDRALLDGEKDVLRPGDEQPHDGAALVGDGLEDGLGAHAAQEHAAPAHGERPHPVHDGAGVVERRNAEKDVVVRLTVVLLLHDGGLGEALVVVQDGLGEARGARAKVDRRVLVLGERDHGVCRGA